jgi:cell wall-associated NlpC family hydrolase
MSVTDAVASIREVQATLQSLFSPARPTASTAVSSAGFANVLSGVTGASATTPVTGLDGKATGPDVVTSALKFVGVPYELGGEDSSGIDCSALVQRAFGDLGIEVPRLVRDQKNIGTEVASLAEAKPGDLIVTGGGDHISIYLGNNTVVHAPYAGRDVSVQKLWVGEGGIDTIRRVIPDAPAGGAGLTAIGGTTTAAALASLLTGAGGAGTDTSSAALQKLAQAAYGSAS